MLTSQFKGKCQNCGKSGYKSAQFMSKMVREDKNEVICNHWKKPGQIKHKCFILLRKNQRDGDYVDTRNGVAGSTTDVVLNTMTENDKIEI